MIKSELQGKAFICTVDVKTKQLVRYAILADQTIYFTVKINSLETMKALERSMSFNVSTSIISQNIDQIIQLSKSNGGAGILYTDAQKTVFNDLTINVLGNTYFQMNSISKLPQTRIEKNDNTGQYDLIFEHDVTIQCPKLFERNELIETVYGMIENGDYILYYLNEFRHGHKIPILVHVGPGGAGKTNAGINPFVNYKYPGKVCKNYFGGDNSTGELGNTSLIVEEESDKKKSPNLSLNTLKDATTTDDHYIRRLYFDGVTARGFLTFLFSCNDNTRSYILNLLNAKGEDVISIRRRTSTFYFDKSLGDYLQLRDATTKKTFGQLFSEYIKIDIYGSGSSNMDRHLNYLERVGFFNAPKFNETSYNMLTVHSPRVNVCESLSNDMAVLLEELYVQFIIKRNVKHILKYGSEEVITRSVRGGSPLIEWKPNPLEQAIMTITKGKPAKRSLIYNLNVVAKDAFEISRSNNNYVINLVNSEILQDAYVKYNGPDTATFDDSGEMF